MSRWLRLALLLAVVLPAKLAAAQDLRDRFSFRADLTGMYLHEDEAKNIAEDQQIAGPLTLGYGDLRLILDGRRLPGNFDVHLDGRIRLTGGLTGGITTTALDSAGSSETTARGYLGGREYELNEMWVRGRWSKLDFGLGRMVVTEADSMRIDGTRFWIHAQKHWDLSLYAGGYPDPYSRSVNTDYVTGNPYGKGTGIAFGGGGSVRYSYNRIYGWFSANGAYLGGDDDGGPVTFTVNTMGLTPTQTFAAPADYKREEDRVWLTWSNFWRPIQYIDFFHDIVVDAAGAAGTQLTRLDFLGSIHAKKYFTLRLGYDHMSAIAIEMYLAHLLSKPTDFIPGTIANNLTIDRTARDEAHATAELSFDRTMLTLEGRLRRRVLDTPSNDPQFLSFNTTTMKIGTQVAPSLGGDATFTVRNNGSVWKLRPSFWFTYLYDYMAKDVFVGGGLGRDFLADRLSLDLSFTYARVQDDESQAAGSMCPAGSGTAIVTTQQTLSNCYGTRNGHNIEPGITISALVNRHWFLFADYRADVALSYGNAAVTTHVLLLRVEARY